MKTDRVIIKIGSNILTSEKGLDQERIEQIARDTAALFDRGYHPIIVSSGAVAAGKNKLGIKGRIQDIKIKQAAAAIGQSTLIRAYERAFTGYQKKVAQILLTKNVLFEKKRYMNARNTLFALLSFDVIPIINENDTVSTDEIRFGDNDQLASLVSILVDASRLIILSDVEGLYTDDPRKNPDARLIDYVKEVTPEMEKQAKGAGTLAGTGGMYSKLKAARRATESGIQVHIINGRKPGLILSLIDGDTPGTRFEPLARRYSVRKGWIAFGSQSRGSLTIDTGAVTALSHNGKSLLPSGIKKVEGNFERGDAVDCIDLSGAIIAKGLVNYNVGEIRIIMGKQTSQIEDILGYKYSDEIIHRDNMIFK